MSTNRISVRSYTNQLRSHFHEYHQLVIPLHGTINIAVGKFKGLVSIGDCVIIKSGQRHDFMANDNARFIVVDTTALPDNILQSVNERVAIDKSLLSFVQFVDIQLNQRVNQSLESTVFSLFFQLLAQQLLTNKMDKRIEKVIAIITQDIAALHSIETLAKQACLSTTQFKKLFKQSTGQTCRSYLTQLRMEKAKALLTHTDTPISIVAEYCGYQSPSAFSRKFKAYFGDIPKAFTH